MNVENGATGTSSHISNGAVIWDYFSLFFMPFAYTKKKKKKKNIN